MGLPLVLYKSDPCDTPKTGCNKYLISNICFPIGYIYSSLPILCVYIIPEKKIAQADMQILNSVILEDVTWKIRSDDVFVIVELQNV